MMHTVRSGETLSAIAQQYGTSVATLVRLNPAISNPNHIRAGQTLTLPADNPRRLCGVGQIQSQSSCAPEPFELAFYWNDRIQEPSAIYAEIFGSDMNFRLRSLFDRNNEHLGTTVLPGEIVIVSNMPVTAQDRDRLERLKDQARLASSGIQQLSPEEAATVKRHIEILDHAVTAQIASTQSASLGILSAAAGTRLRELNRTLENINSLYVDELSRNPGTHQLSPAFFAERQKLFRELDNAANRITMSQLNIRQYSRIKNTLGLSTKSILHNASEIIDRGQVPQLGQRIQTVSGWAKGASRLGWLGIGIDAGLRTAKVSEACSVGSTSECTIVSFQQAGGFVGAAGGGSVGGLVGAKGAVILVVALGVTLGAPAMAIIALTGAAVGAYMGGATGSSVGEAVGQTSGQMFYHWHAQ